MSVPPWQYTLEFTIKGTEDECRDKAAKLEAAAKRLGIPAPFSEEEPNGDLDFMTPRSDLLRDAARKGKQ